MLNKTLLILLFMLCKLQISADIVWNEPVQICEYKNIEFYRNSLKTSDGCILLMWLSNSEDNSACNYVQKFSTDMIPVWNQPVMVASPYAFFHLAETSDGGYLILYQDWYTFTVFKISQAGVHVWDPNGVTAVQSAASTQCSIVLEADRMGGAYIYWRDSNPYVRLQHIDSSGNRTIGENGVIMSLQGARYPSIKVLIDNQAVISYSLDNLTMIKKVNSTGTIQWTQNISTPHPSNQSVVPVLTNSVNGSYYLSICTIDSIHIQKYDMNGTALWQYPYVISGNGAGYHFRGENIRSDLTDDSLLLLWQIGYYSIYVQKLNSHGQEMWPSSGVHVFEAPGSSIVTLDRDNIGGCFISFDLENLSNQGGSVYAQYISPNGATLPDSVFVFYSNLVSKPAMTCQNNTARFYFFDERNGLTGIYHQSMNSAGNLLVPVANSAVIVGVDGSISNPLLQPKQQGCLAIWLASRSNSLFNYIYYNYINAQGGSMFTDGPRLLVSDGPHDIVGLSALTTPEGYTFVSWYEADTSKLKAQLIDVYGNILWSEFGEIVHQGTIYESNFRLSQDNGAVYIVWSSKDSNLRYRVFGQKYVSGVAQWTVQGLQLSFDNPAVPSLNHYLTDFYKRYILFNDRSIAFGSLDRIYIMLIDENGISLPPYNSCGSLVTVYEDLSWYGQYYQSCFEHQNSLYTQFFYQQKLYDPYEYEYYYVNHYRIQKSNQSDIQLLGPTGLSFSGMVILSSNDQLFGLERIFDELRVNLLDSDFNPTLLSYYSFPSSFGWTKRALPYGRFIILATYSQYQSHSLAHLYINSNGIIQIPSTSLILSDSSIFNVTSCVNDNMVYVAWSKGSQLQSNNLYLQRLTDGGVINEDQNESLTSIASLQSNHPNPFKGSTVIAVELKQPSVCELSIYNVKGQYVKTLHKGKLDKGDNSFRWDGFDQSGNSCAEGVYFYQLKEGNHKITKKMVKLN